MWQTTTIIVSFIANIVQISVGVIALYVAWTQRDKISAAFSVLLSYSLQTSLTDLRHWIEKLNEHTVDGTDESKRVRMSLANIFGKIKGNPILYNHFGEKMLKRLKLMMQDLDEGKPVTETSKISLCSEIKESLTTLEIENHTPKLLKKYE